MRLSETTPCYGTSQERHEGGAPYHRTVRRATGLWIVVFVQITQRVEDVHERAVAALEPRTDTSTRRRIHSLSAGALGSFDRAPRATFRCNSGTLRGERSRRRKMKRTYQPNARRRSKVHGFRKRMSTRAGQAVVRARRRKGRAKLTA